MYAVKAYSLGLLLYNVGIKMSCCPFKSWSMLTIFRIFLLQGKSVKNFDIRIYTIVLAS